MSRRRPVTPVLRSAIVLVLALLLVGATQGAVPAEAGRHRPGPPVVEVTYDALGDSYGSGYGVPPYSETCGRSDAAYAAQLDGFRVWRLRVRLDDFVACAGATTTSLVEGGQLEALDRHTRLVTLSIGGNDIRWGEAVSSCLLGTDEQCAATQETIRALITDELPALLDTVYSQVRRRAPWALVVVTGYAHLFTPEAGPYFNASPLEQEQLNEGGDLLNDVLRAAARRHHFGFVDVIDRFRGHGANSPDPWILGLADPGRFHPNAAGYAAYTDAVASALGLRPGRGRLM